MKNFISFRFTDNDFHSHLCMAINYVVQNRDGDMSLEAWREFVIRGIVGLSGVGRISDWALANTTPVARDYIEKFLVVREVDKLSDLDSGFEGYVYDTNLGTVYYMGY